MPTPRLIPIVLMLLALPVFAAPELSDDDRDRLVDGTSDEDSRLDEQDGLYVLLRSASDWMGDDFSGEAGAATAPKPDYAFIKDNPDQARGNVFLIEGWLVQHDRYPTKDNAKSDKLYRAGDPDWGDQVTRWTIVTEKGDPTATIIVLFNDPKAKMIKPTLQSKVRVAARFYKLWTINDVEGKPFTYPVFVGGAAEVTSAATAGATGGGGTSTSTIITLGVVVMAGGFFVVRVLLKRSGGGSMTRQRLDEIRRERERYEDEDEEEEIDDLPEDPVAALDVLRERHETD